jgi:hypothetical protein
MHERFVPKEVEMKSSLLMMGLLAGIGCGGLEADDATPSAPGEITTIEEHGATPRVDRFASLSASSLPDGNIKPTAWSDQTPATLNEQRDTIRPHFDATIVREAEAHRLRARLEGGAR